MTSYKVFLTGAGSGLGRGLALHSANAGCDLILVDRDADALQETAALIGSAPISVRTEVLDLSSGDQIGALFAKLGGERIDVLINNAGIQYISAIEDFSEERWSLLIDVMLKAPFLLSKAVLPGMRANGFGRIINIGSIHSLVASPFKSAYVAAKHGLLGFAKTAALECGATDITINTICPAYVRTPLVDAQIRSQAEKNGLSEQDVIEKIMLEPMPKKAFITIEEIAAAVDFLMGAMARNITGQTIVIDGGWTAR